MIFRDDRWYNVLIQFRKDLLRLGIKPKLLSRYALARGQDRIWPLKPVPRG